MTPSPSIIGHDLVGNNTLKEQTTVLPIIAVNQSAILPNKTQFFPVTQGSGDAIKVQTLPTIIGLSNHTQNAIRSEEGASSSAFARASATTRPRAQTPTTGRGARRLRRSLNQAAPSSASRAAASQAPAIENQHAARHRREAEAATNSMTAETPSGIYTGPKDRNGTLVPLDLLKYLQVAPYDNHKAKGLCRTLMVDPALKNMDEMAKEVCKIIFSFSDEHLYKVADPNPNANITASNALTVTEKARADENIKLVIEGILNSTRVANYNNPYSVTAEVIRGNDESSDYITLKAAGHSRFDVFFYCLGLSAVVLFIPGSMLFIYSMVKLRKAVARQEREMVEIAKNAKQSMADHAENLIWEGKLTQSRESAKAALEAERIPLFTVIDEIKIDEAPQEDEMFNDILKSIFSQMEEKIKEDEKKTELEMQNDALVFKGELTPYDLDNGSYEAIESEFSELYAACNENDDTMSDEELAKYINPTNASENRSLKNQQIEYRDYSVSEENPFRGYYRGFSKPPLYGDVPNKQEDNEATSTQEKVGEKPKFISLPNGMNPEDKEKILKTRQEIVSAWKAKQGELFANRQEVKDYLLKKQDKYKDKMKNAELLRSVISEDLSLAQQEGLKNISNKYIKYNKDKIEQVQDLIKEEMSNKDDASFLIFAPSKAQTLSKPTPYKETAFGKLQYNVPRKNTDLYAFFEAKQYYKNKKYIELFEEALQSLSKEKKELHSDVSFITKKYIEETDKTLQIMPSLESIQTLRAYGRYPEMLALYQNQFSQQVATLKEQLMIKLSGAQEAHISHLAYRSMQEGSLLMSHLRKRNMGVKSPDIQNIAESVTKSAIKSLGVNGDATDENTISLSASVLHNIIEQATVGIEEKMIELVHQNLDLDGKRFDDLSVVHGTLVDFIAYKKELINYGEPALQEGSEEEKQKIKSFLDKNITKALEKQFSLFVEKAEGLIDSVKAHVATAFSTHVMLHLKGTLSEVASDIITQTVREVLMPSLTQGRLAELVRGRKIEKVEELRVALRKKLKLPEKENVDTDSVCLSALEAQLQAHKDTPRPRLNRGKKQYDAKEVKGEMQVDASRKLLEADKLRAQHQRLEQEVLKSLKEAAYEGEQGVGAHEGVLNRLKKE